MNTFQSIDTEYVQSSRTIEIVLVSDNNSSKVFFVYNFEGNSYRVFESHLGLIRFFQNKIESDFHFSTDTELDSFLSKVRLPA